MGLFIKKKALKKAISVVTTLTTVVWLSGVSMLAVPVAQAAVVDGDLIKSNATNSDGSPTLASLDVYIVKLVGTKKFKRLILNPTVFESYGHLSWGSIQTVSQAVMDEYTTSSLVRVDTDPLEKVYAMAPDGDIGSKSWVNLTTTQFVDEAGSDPDSIYTINAVDGGNYTAVTDVTAVSELLTFYSTGTLPGVTPVPSGTLAVALSASTPASATLPDGATGVVMTKINMSASSDSDATINSLTTYRSGVGTSTNIPRVYLYEGDKRLTNGKSVNSTTGKSIFTGLNYVVPAGTTKTLSIVVDVLATATDNHIMGIKEVSDIVTSGAVVSGSFPIAGNSMGVANVTLGTATTDRAGSASYTRKIGEKEAIVAKFTVATTNENSELRRLSIYNSSNDILDNMTLWRGSEKLSSATENDRYFDFVLDTPNKITKGETITYTLKADIAADNVSNTANLYIKNDADILVVGDIYGYGVDIDNALYDGGDSSEYTAVTLEAGDVTIVSSGPVANTVVVDQNDVVLMDLSITALNATTIEAYGFDLTETGSIIAGLEATDIEFNCAGTQSVTSVVAATHTWTDFIELSAGVTYECSLKVDLESTIDNGDTLLATLDISDWSFRDKNTDALFTSASTTYNVIPTADQAGATMTVAAAGLTVAAATSPAAKTWVKGTANIEVAGYTFAAGDADDIMVDDITLTSCYGTAATSLSCGSHASNSASSAILSVSLYDGASPVGTAKAIDSSGNVAYTDLGWTIPAGTTKTLTVKATLNNSLPATTVYVTLGLEDGSVASFYDNGNKTLSGTDPAADINTTTSGSTGWNASTSIYQTAISIGTLAVDTPTTTPATNVAVAGATGIKFSEVKLTATREDFTVSKMAFRNINSSFDDNVSKIYVKYPTNGSGSTTKTTECTLASGAVSCAGLTVFVPNPDTAGYNNYAVVEVIADMQTITAGADAGDAPEFILTFGGDLEALGASSGAKLYEQTVSVTDVTGNGTDSLADTSGATLDAATSLVTTDGTKFAVGDIVYVDENASGTFTSASEDYMFVTGISVNTLTVVRTINGSGASLGTGYAYTTGKNIYKYTTILNDVNPMNVQGTKLTFASGTPAHGGQNTAEEVMEFTVTANTSGDAKIRKGDMNSADTAASDFVTASFAGTWAEIDGTDITLTAPTTGEVQGSGYLRITEDLTGTTEGIMYTFGTVDQDLTGYTGIAFWVRSSVASSSPSAAGTPTWTFTTVETTGATNSNAFSISAANKWQLVQIDFSTTTTNQDLVDSFQIISTSDVANAQTFDIDNVILYKDKLVVDTKLNAVVTAADGGVAYLKQNGTIVAAGNAGWEDTADSTSTGNIVFIPYNTYNDIEINGSDTFNVEMDTTLFTDSTATENLSLTVDLGNSSNAYDVYWYDVEGSDGVTYAGVNATDKVSNTVTY